MHPEKFLRIGPVVGFAPAFCVERGSPPRRVLHGALVRSVRQQCKFYCRMRVRNGRLKTDTGGLQPSSPLKLCIQRWPKTNPQTHGHNSAHGHHSAKRRRHHNTYSYIFLACNFAKYVIVRPLSTMEYTSVASLFHCRQWSG